MIIFLLLTICSASCIIESRAVSGVNNGLQVSNKPELLEVYDLSDYYVKYIVHCQDDSGNVIGLFASIVNRQDPDRLIIKKSFGQIRGFCTKLNLFGELDSIRASYSPDTGTVSAISYRRDDNQRTFGALLSNFEEWNFNETSRFIGFHGRIDEERIT